MKHFLIIILILNTLCLNIFAKEKEKKSEEKPILGFIFNANDILLDLESYQGGIGIKLLKPDISYRGLADIYYSSSSDDLLIGLGLAIEKPFRKGRVKPYWGGFLYLQYKGLKSITDSDNWTNDITYTFSAGPIFGIEVFLVDFISFFAEYSIDIDYTIEYVKSSVSGVESTTDTENNWGVDTGLGNNGKIGITIYIDKANNLKKSK